jgi:hypothetical protein
VSAGKNASTASSASVTSTGRAEHGGGREERQRSRLGDKLERDHDAGVVARRRRAARAGAVRRVSPQLVQQLRERRIRGHIDLLPQPLEQMRAPFHEIGSTRRKAFGMQREPQHVDRWPQQ